MDTEQKLKELRTKRRDVMRAYEDAIKPDWQQELETELMHIDAQIRAVESCSEVQYRGVD